MKSFVLKGIKKLYDGTSASHLSIKHNCDIYVQNGRIVGASFLPHLHVDNPEIFTKINASEMYVTPGLIDCHTHITVDGLSNAERQRMNSPTMLLYVQRILYRTLVDGGVTTAVDLGGAPAYIKNLIDEGVLIGPRLKTAICMLSSTGGHADTRDEFTFSDCDSLLFPAISGRPSSIVDGIDDCIKRVRMIDQCGADIIKICVGESIWQKRPNKRRPGDLNIDELTAICAEAANRGLQVAAHAHSKTGAILAIKAGVSALQHVTQIDDEACSFAHKHGCTITPTTWVLNEVCNTNQISAKLGVDVESLISTRNQMISTASKTGIQILFGTDPIYPGMHGQNYRELHALTATGLNALSTWYAATGAAADSLRDDQIGRVKLGANADLLVFDKDVISEPNLFTSDSLREVIKGGQAYRGLWSQLSVPDFNSHFRGIAV